MIGRIGTVSHNLPSVMGAIELIIVCAFVCKVGYFDAQIRETNRGGLTYVPLWKHVSNYF